MALTWTTSSTPVGELLLVTSPRGVARVAFACEGFDEVRQSVAAATGETLVEGESEELETQLAEYFAGERTAFDVALDWRLTQGFRARVQRALIDIPYGETQSYADIALRLDNPKAVRAVGSGCASNPLPILAPCHRVVRSDGSLGNYRGGAAMKKMLLELESGVA
ncbi:methylated-DNA--[protein]-cysteine S-methyltransferase [Corynebacterium sp. LK2510]|uniref:methylated-DNA--[protein]-cysteine S-methyltransferase n=1 Tax=Corynebacterium sp. LK2510 TaxID=3110472 RepID=UPI0034CF4445